MTFLILSFFAGILTILAPCVLPLLPIVIGASGTDVSRKSKPFIIIASLSVSVIVFTLLLKASTLLIDIPQSFWTWFSGGVIVLLGVMTLFPDLWTHVPLMQKLQVRSNKAVGAGHTKDSVVGDGIVGAALGPVFSTCSPTYLFILATVLPASFTIGLGYLIAFTVGMALSLALVAFIGQKLITRLSVNHARTELLKKVFGVLFIVVGVAIISGYDKKLETYLLDLGIGGTVLFEERLIEGAMDTDAEPYAPDTPNVDGTIDVPRVLRLSFPNTDWSKADRSIEQALSGGPSKDGIPAIDNPTFTILDAYTRPDSVQAIVLADGETMRVYPYNILMWHEIVNDTVNDVPVAITFCPLCGSAIVYDRTLPTGVTTFGVSGTLIESNMVMYDRATESLFQQSTGMGLAGEHHGVQLSLVPFQLLTMGEVRAQYPNALVLSEDTGHRRDYALNPYAGYESSDDFVFSPSSVDARYPSKTTVVAFRVNNTPVAVPWLALTSGSTYTTSVSSTKITLTKEGSELTITDTKGANIPFYFEMWFSWAVQHGENGIVFDPAH